MPISLDGDTQKEVPKPASSFFFSLSKEEFQFIRRRCKKFCQQEKNV
jgi:hypothetical protein